MSSSMVRLELRRLRRRPLLSGTIVLAVATAIAAATTLAHAVRHFVLRPLPAVARPGELVDLHRATVADEHGAFSLAEYRELAANLRSLDGVAAFRDQGVSLADDGAPQLAVLQVVSGNYFTTLGAAPAAGRLLTAADDRPGAPPVIVLDHALWLRRYGGDPSVVGRATRVNGRSVEVVGVAPAGFAGTSLAFRFDGFLPLSQLALADPRFTPADADGQRLELVARRPPGATAARVAQELARHAAAFAESAPERWREARLALAPTTGVEPSLRAPALVFFAALATLGALALLVVAANVASLLVADAAERRPELAIRSALGAGRRDLLAPLALRAVLLFGAAGLVGSALSVAGARLLARFGRGLSIPINFDLRPDATTLVLGFGVALGLGVAVGAFAAGRGARSAPAAALSGLRATGDVGQRRRSPLVAVQVLASTVLLALALLFAQQGRAASRVDAGLSLDRVAVLDLHVGLLGLSPEAERRVVDEALHRLSEIPAVEVAAAASPFPFSFGRPRATASPAEATGDPAAKRPIERTAIAPALLELLGVPLVAGRDFAAEDRAGAPAVAIVNETLAAAFWPGESPIGREVRLEDGVVRVVGVARDSRLRRPWEPAAPQLYRPLAQSGAARATLAVRLRSDLATTAPQLAAAVRAAAPDLGVGAWRPAHAQLATLLLPQRAAAAVATALGLFAALVSAVGLYALVAHRVAAARREIGVRQALGAGPRTVTVHFVRRGFAGAAPGLLGSVPLVAVALPALAPLLPVREAIGWSWFFAAPAMLVAVLLFASWLPARRAARLDPVAALRQD